VSGAGGFLEFVALDAAMGFSIFLSLPLVLRRSEQARTATLLGAVAIGIMAFLLADIFGNVAALIANPGNPYLTDPLEDGVFAAGVAAAFGLLFLFGHRGGRTTPTARQLAVIIAIGMAFQNLTEGLVFGVSWAAGAVSLLTVVFLGFVLQNITEGFPIGAPFFGTDERPVRLLVALFVLGGVPTLLGGVVGYFWNSTPLKVFFDALASGAILYVLVPMIRGALRPTGDPAAQVVRDRLVYLGVLGGFLLGFLANAI
jgi:ZIP family zinc transporter